MKLSYKSKSFLLTLLIYLTLAFIVFWQFNSRTSYAEKNQVNRELPVKISMFQAPPIVVPVEPSKVKPPEIQPPNPPKPIKKKVVKKKKPKVKPKAKPLPKLVEKVIEEPVDKVIEPIQVAESEPMVVEVPPMYNSSQIADSEERYLSELKQMLIRLAKNSYPKRAKSRGWDGEVVLQFVLSKDGSISKLIIANKNGRKILNKAALSIIKEKMAMKFKPFYDEINREIWKLTVPVNFILQS